MQLPVIFNDRYQLFKKIGEGGLAEVYQAQDMSLGRMVAVKVLREQYTHDPTFLVNFHREAQSAAKLNNAYIVAVYDFGQYQNRPYIVMEWIDGADLRTVINERITIMVDRAIDYAIQVCSAVGAAHRAGLVHGDLKPGNILIAPNNQAKVADFGLARALGESAMDEGEVVWGTPAYFAPEQASGDRVLPATDVYAIGIIIYEMVSGRVPFVGVDDQDVARKQLYEAHIPVDRLNPAVPEPLARIVDAAMAKNPNERFLTSDHLREALIMYKQGDLQGASHLAPISAVVGSPVHGRGQGATSAPAQHRKQPTVQPTPPKKSSSSNFDILMLILGIIAIIAVLGLVPLFVAVYTTYAPSANGSSGNLQAGQVSMPDLVGLDEPTAQAALANMGLILQVEGQEPHPTWPAFAITRQSVPAGAVIDSGSTVTVFLSQGPSLIELPDVTGMPIAEAEQVLTSLDLVVRRYEDWSPETPGHVVTQDPPSGSVVANRTLITLIVSSGSRTPVAANFGNQITLNAYELPRLQYRAGEIIDINFLLQAATSMTNNYNFFIRLTTPQGGTVSEIDVQPQAGPTSSWPPGQLIIDPYQLLIPTTAASGDYQIRIGFYDPTNNTRVSIVDPGRAEPDGFGGLILRTIQVVQ